MAFECTKFGAKLDSQQGSIGGAIICAQFGSQLGAVVAAQLWSQPSSVPSQVPSLSPSLRPSSVPSLVPSSIPSRDERDEHPSEEKILDHDTKIMMVVMGPKEKFPDWVKILSAINNITLSFIYGSFDEAISTDECDSHKLHADRNFDCSTLYIPNTTWTEGRNMLAGEVLKREKRVTMTRMPKKGKYTIGGSLQMTTWFHRVRKQHIPWRLCLGKEERVSRVGKRYSIS